jgi:hypothetical protein
MNKILIILIIIFIFSACSRPIAPPPEAIYEQPWGSVDLNITQDSSQFDIKNSLGDSLKYKLQNSKDNNASFNILAISGGGSQGAYGCGVLSGWYHHGDMPKFDIVTGISTGSIISTFIFLGDENIDYISKIYTSIKTSDIYYYNFFKIFGGSSITSTTPLKEMIKKYITEELLDEVAREYKAGRRLYVGTTNIDTGNLVVWDMTAIAASEKSNKLQLYRDIIYASSAMPGVFDPQYFEINYKDKKYYQMHIDGGMNSYVFMIGMHDDWKKVLDLSEDLKLNLSLYILANRQYRYKKQTKALEGDSALSILIAVAKNSVDLIYDRSIYRLYKACESKNYHFNYTGIDDNITLKYLPHQFEEEEMQSLFSQGYDKGINGVQWQKNISEDEISKHD